MKLITIIIRTIQNRSIYYIINSFSGIEQKSTFYI